MNSVYTHQISAGSEFENNELTIGSDSPEDGSTCPKTAYLTGIRIVQLPANAAAISLQHLFARTGQLEFMTDNSHSESVLGVECHQIQPFGFWKWCDKRRIQVLMCTIKD